MEKRPQQGCLLRHLGGAPERGSAGVFGNRRGRGLPPGPFTGLKTGRGRPSRDREVFLSAGLDDVGGRGILFV